MAFNLNGTIYGGTFNNVSGDMNQVSYRNEIYLPSHHPGVAPSRRGIDGVLAQQQSVKSLRPERRAFRQQNLPYDMANRSHRRGIQSPLGGMSHAMATSEATAIFHDTVPTYSGDYGNLSIDNQMQGQYPETIHHQDAGRPPAESTSTNTFTSVAGNVTQFHVTSYGESGLDILYRFIAMGAAHDSGERFAEPACHPGTRVAVLEQLGAWAHDTRPESSILWLHGSAGMGKSAIAQMFAGNCKNSGRLGASFFFKRGDPERGSWHRLFSTIAYQLAHSVPGFLLRVQHAVEANKLVISQAKELQFQQLIVETLQRAPVPEMLPILILDGLDECEDPKIQQDILRLLINAIHRHQLPIRILIVSRPEPHIRGIIETNATFEICRLVELFADETAYGDIRKYLCDEFSRIQAEYFADGLVLGDRWPGSEALEHLVQKSSGIFIYAATVIRFVGDLYSGSHPQERLNSVLNLDPESTAPLDDLYTQILSVVKHNDQQLRILHVIWQRVSSLSFLRADPEEIDLLLDLRRGTSRLALRCLHSLLMVPPIRTRFGMRPEIKMFHASFTDFLGDPRRSKGWCVSLPRLHSDFLHCMIRLLSSPPSTNRARAFYSEIVQGLSKILCNVTPCDQLLDLLRNTVFQNSLFLEDEPRYPWPQRDSEYPSDLIQLWERHQFVCTLSQNLKSTEDRCSPTFKYDSFYKEILSGQPTLIFILSAHTMEPWLFLLLELFDLSYRILEPFFQFREHLDFPFPEGDSPLDFIADPNRAGPLYMEPRAVAESVMVRWIIQAKEFIVTGDLIQVDLVQFIEYCGPSLKILDELATLDLSKICDQISDDQVHKEFHRHRTRKVSLSCIVDWLQTFPEPPQEVIDFWETQVAAIRQCEYKYFGYSNE
ncbi:AAA-16 domain-containing protein [Mycena venus]|uniref:AAA-16 domain-containing protein n=1 Tax=Mycena venus TaxID=2733690 RepID=A0A8H6YZK7_9AGAR|nr:AAA-16 domain-containing protein [Mycena venus]